MEIEKTLVVSAGHMTLDDYQSLTDMAEDGSTSVIWTDLYLLVHLPFFQNVSSFSKEFQLLFRFAADHPERFTYLKLSDGGEYLDGFPTFDW